MSKKIIIGETYLFDVLNETNKAETTTLVTVVKKIKLNKYVVISVNNGDVFITKAKYLTPFVDPEKATVIRCQYGTTEFTQNDVKYFNLVNNIFELFDDVLNNMDLKNLSSNDNVAELIQDFNEVKEWGKEVGDKVQKYANISDYKEIIHTLAKIKTISKDCTIKPSDTDKQEPISSKPMKNDEFFNKYFNDLVMKYLSNDISFDDFSKQTIDNIKQHYPLEQLKNEGKVTISQIDDITDEIIHSLIQTKTIGFVIGIDDSDNLYVKTICLVEDSDITEELYDLRDFVYKIYPDLKSKDSIIPKYRFGVIAVPKRGDEEDE